MTAQAGLDAPAGVVARHLGPLVHSGTLAGVVYGLVTPTDESLGHLTSQHHLLDEDTSLEIGSVTKVFTGILLADMVERGDVTLEDQISAWLPGASLPRGRAAREMTLLDLATHRSGLGRLPRNVIWAGLTNRTNPYAGYSVDRLYRALARTGDRVRPGIRYRYSNYGYAVLGHVLSLAAGRPYAELISERVCHPLGLHHTTIGPPSTPAASVALGHRRGRAVARWDDLGAIAPAGGLYSTGRDMLAFVKANLQPETNPLAQPLEAAQAPIRPTNRGRDSIGLAWHHRTSGSHQLTWHNGGTAGFSSIAVLDRPARLGLVLLATSGPSLRMPLDRAAWAIHHELAAACPAITEAAG
jgi:CubicO group peptidase (beta-lactamase class C family)